MSKSVLLIRGQGTLYKLIGLMNKSALDWLCSGFILITGLVLDSSIVLVPILFHFEVSNDQTTLIITKYKEL